jgi:hypothetical protein
MGAIDDRLEDLIAATATAFTMKLSPSDHDTYNARTGEHDDLLLAVALPVWWRRQQRPAGVWFICAARWLGRRRPSPGTGVRARLIDGWRGAPLTAGV